MREALRRRMLVKMAGEVGAKLEDTAEQRLEKMKQDLETLKQKLEGAWLGTERESQDACNDTALAGRSVAVEVRGGRGVSSLHGMGPAIDGTAARLCPAGGAGGSDRGREPLPRDPGHQGGAAGGRHGRGRVPPLRSRFSRRGADERKALAARE